MPLDMRVQQMQIVIVDQSIDMDAWGAISWALLGEPWCVGCTGPWDGWHGLVVRVVDFETIEDAKAAIANVVAKVQGG